MCYESVDEHCCKGCLRKQAVVFLFTCGEVHGMWKVQEHREKSSKVQWPLSSEVKSKTSARRLYFLLVSVKLCYDGHPFLET